MRSKLSALVLVACVSLVCGCGRTEPQFSHREGLSPVMQDYVRTVVDQKFGTPHKIRVWDKLPLHPHAAVATVNDAPQIGGGPTVSMQVSEQATDVTTLTVTDIYKPVEMPAFSITGGPDAEQFKISGATGTLAFRNPPTHKTPTDSDKNNTYGVIVQVSDGSLTDSQVISVTVLEEGKAIGEPKKSPEPEDDPKPTPSLSVLLAESHRELKSGQEVAWVSGTPMPAGGVPDLFESYNTETHFLSLLAAPAKAAQPGDKIVIGPGEALTHGRMLYAEHCQHCHGVAGDGQGPTAPYLNVRPRDYRRGVFKFTSTKVDMKAQRGDLARVVEEGIPGTYMPSFKLLKAVESQAIIEYVLFLSMRGETELKLSGNLGTDYSIEEVASRVKNGETEAKITEEFVKRAQEGEFDEAIADTSEQMINQWLAAQAPEAVIAPTEKRYLSDADSVQRGRELFLSANLNCVACHGETGLGDGAQTYSITTNTVTKKPNVEPGLFDDWGNKIKPRNLRLGMYRGGRRPIDIYSRIEAGIKGTPMSAFGAKMTEQQKWDLVNYILQMPHEPRAPGAGSTSPTPSTSPAPVVSTAH